MSKKIRIAIYLEGGNIQSVISNSGNVKAEIFDVDNLKAQGISGEIIDGMWDDKCDELHFSI